MKEKRTFQIKKPILQAKHVIMVCFIIATVLFWDLLTKSVTDGYNINIFEGVFNFSSVHNTGAAWSILANATWLLTITSIIFVLAISAFDLWFNNKTKLYSIGLGLVLGGAVGNLIDRLFFGYVRDFIRLEFMPWFPIFNVADICLVVGVILIIVYAIFQYPKFLKHEEVYKYSAKDFSDDENSIAKYMSQKQVQTKKIKLW